jgi:kynurenine formamidase
VIINSGWHKYYVDNRKYFYCSLGLYKEAGEWFVEKRVKGVGVDQQALDKQLGTYEKETGRAVKEDFPYWRRATT